MEAEDRGTGLDEMERGPKPAQGMEAVTGGLEAMAQYAEKQTTMMTEQIKPQRILMDSWERQQKMNQAMTKAETMGVCPRMVKTQTLESWVEEVRIWSNQCNEEELSSLKYLNFVNSVRESENIEMQTKNLAKLNQILSTILWT